MLKFMLLILGVFCYEWYKILGIFIRVFKVYFIWLQGENIRQREEIKFWRNLARDRKMLQVAGIHGREMWQAAGKYICSTKHKNKTGCFVLFHEKIQTQRIFWCEKKKRTNTIWQITKNEDIARNRNLWILKIGRKKLRRNMNSVVT